MTRSIARSRAEIPPDNDDQQVDPAAAALNETIRRTVRTLMGYRGIKGPEVYKRLGISSNSMSNKMTGRTEFTLSEVAVMAEIFKVPAALLVTGITIDPDGFPQNKCFVDDSVEEGGESLPDQPRRPIERPARPTRFVPSKKQDHSRRPRDNRPGSRPAITPLRAA